MENVSHSIAALCLCAAEPYKNIATSLLCGLLTGAVNSRCHSQARVLVVWDFDWTMVEENSDTWVLERLGARPAFLRLQQVREKCASLHATSTPLDLRK